MNAKKDLIAAAKFLVEQGLNLNSAGNCSLRLPNGFLITPSAYLVDDMQPDDMVEMDYDGHVLCGQRPSSEFHFHLDIYRHRPDVAAIVHTHASFSSILACMHQSIPAFHYMVAMAGGLDIPCTPYALFGTEDLSHHVVAALQTRNACLMANHGMIALGQTLAEAKALALEVEHLAKLYWHVLQSGQEHILSEAQMAEVLMKFKSYKQK